MQNLWFCDRSGIFLAVRSLFTCRIFFFCYNSWCRHLLFAHDEKKWNWMKIFSVRLNSTSVLDHAQKRMPRSTWYYFFRRSKITWGHKILSFKQCGVIDAPHCFEASWTRTGSLAFILYWIKRVSGFGVQDIHDPISESPPIGIPIGILLNTFDDRIFVFYDRVGHLFLLQLLFTCSCIYVIFLFQNDEWIDDLFFSFHQCLGKYSKILRSRI